MAQVNSSPGQNQIAGNLAVTAATSEVGAEKSHVFATATIVPYAQAETGRQVTQSDPIRK
jgi:hypothetical protein